MSAGAASRGRRGVSDYDFCCVWCGRYADKFSNPPELCGPCGSYNRQADTMCHTKAIDEAKKWHARAMAQKKQLKYLNRAHGKLSYDHSKCEDRYFGMHSKFAARGGLLKAANAEIRRLKGEADATHEEGKEGQESDGGAVREGKG